MILLSVWVIEKRVDALCLLQADAGERFILEGKRRFQFKRTEPMIYRVTGLSSTNNANVIFSISPKQPVRKSDWEALEKVIR